MVLELVGSKDLDSSSGFGAVETFFLASKTRNRTINEAEERGEG